MMKLLMGVINAKRIFLRCDVVSKHKVKLISAVSHSCNRCDSVVRLAFSFSVNECFFVGVASPSFEYLVSKVNESVFVLAVYSDNGHRPFYDTSVNVLKALENYLFFNRGFRHCKSIMTALKMFV